MKKIIVFASVVLASLASIVFGDVGGPTGRFLQIRTTLQPSSTVYFSSGTVQNYMDVKGVLSVPHSATPPPTDCDHDLERGRIYVDTNAASGSQLFVCEGGSGWVAIVGSGSGGGASALEVFNPFDTTRTSPTATISASEAFRGLVSGSTYNFRMNFSSVASVGDTDYFVNHSSVASNYLKLSSATITYLKDGSSILKQNSLQSGATFFTSSGAVAGQLNVFNTAGDTGKVIHHRGVEFGYGTNSPTSALHIAGAATDASPLAYIDGNTNNGLEVTSAGTGSGSALVVSNTSSGRGATFSSTSGPAIVTAGGAVGISTSVPVAMLSVASHAVITGTVTVGSIRFADGSIQVTSAVLTGAGSGDMVLASSQTSTGWKNFLSPAGSTFTYGVVAGSVTTTGQATGQLGLGDADGSNFAYIRAPNVMSADWYAVWPSSVATAGQALIAQQIVGSTVIYTHGTVASGGGGSGTPGGSNPQAQYNNSGSFGGMASFTYHNSSNTITISSAANFSSASTMTLSNVRLILSGTSAIEFPNGTVQVSSGGSGSGGGSGGYAVEPATAVFRLSTTTIIGGPLTVGTTATFTSTVTYVNVSTMSFTRGTTVQILGGFADANGHGASGYVWTSNGFGVPPTWQAASAGGGGGGSPVEFFSAFDATRTSPTLSVSLGDSLKTSVNSSTFSISVDFSTIPSRSDVVLNQDSLQSGGKFFTDTGRVNTVMTAGNYLASSSMTISRAGTPIIELYKNDGTASSSAQIISFENTGSRVQRGSIIFNESNTGSIAFYRTSTSRLGLFDSSNRRLTIGDSEAGVDFGLYFDGEDNDGSLQWREDENQFDIQDATLFTSSVGVSGQLQVAETAKLLRGAQVSTLTITSLTSQDCIGTDGSGNLQAGTCGGEGGSSDNLGSHIATTTLNMNAKAIGFIGAGSSTFVGDGSLVVRSTNGTTSPSIFTTGIISSGTGVGQLSFSDFDGSNFVTLIGSQSISRDISFRLPASTAPVGGTYLKQIAVEGSTSTLALVQATHTATIVLSSGTTFNSKTYPVFNAPINTSITIFNIRAWTMPSGSTVTYQLDERNWKSGNSAGTSVFSVAYSTAHDSGVETTSFNNASIAAGASLVLTTPSNSAAGNPTRLMIQISYKEDD